MSAVATYTLRLGDDALVAAQRLAGWISRAPELEEDLALANIALDLLGQARSLLTYAGSFDGRSEDDLAYLRDEREFCNVQFVELPNGDFGMTIARMLFFSAYQYLLYDRLSGSADPTLAAVAARAVKEVAYHRDHAVQWTLRLGDGTDESHVRMQAALEACWPYTAELFESDALTREVAAAGVGVDPGTFSPQWASFVDGILKEATLTVPVLPARVTGGRRGIHTEHMGYLLAEMQYLRRSYPEDTEW
ncbi:MAG: phenylacetate-CoA oxygenase subunit PaaC [Actinobacteria bacterium]|nr:phenylacetate-CoA oxygenase subunit PaaC [Actinomycetota bacterium]MBI3687283.1 phenylacetate-CoA oxygenase subunit PaaC [Actinomycetota bacterium]